MRFSSSNSPFSQDDFLPSMEEITLPLDKKPSTSKKEPHTELKELFPVDETEEFYDPFSDLNLFLAKRVKQELLREKNPKTWSHKIASILFKEIMPEFTKRFPTYRLGQTALKKTFDKIRYYLDRFQEEKKALHPSGRLNVGYLLKKNLSAWSKKASHTDAHPYQTASQLAMKVSQCIAFINGERPSVDKLTETICSMQRHLLPKKERDLKLPQKSYDLLDKTLVRIQLEELIKQPLLSQKELKESIHGRLLELEHLQKISNFDDLRETLSLLFAERVHPSLPSYKGLSFVTEKNIKTLLFLAPLQHLSTEELKRNLQAAISYIEALEMGSMPANCPVLKQEIFAFVKEAKVEENFLEALLQLFVRMKKTPEFWDLSLKEIEIILWRFPTKKISEPLKNFLSYFLASSHIDHPEARLGKIVEETLKNLTKIKALSFTSIEEKLELWTLQHDMVISCLTFPKENPLLQTIVKEESVEKSLALTLKVHPELTPWRNFLEMRLAILHKYHWYQKEETSSYQRFLAWHEKTSSSLLEKMVPLMPLDPNRSDLCA
jgi:hypothetical protein